MASFDPFVRPLLWASTADVNGTAWLQFSPEIDLIVEGNGIPDCGFELRIVQEALNDPGFSVNGLTHDMVRAAWDANSAQFASDAGRYWRTFGASYPGAQELLLGMMLLGDGGAAWDTADSIMSQGSVGVAQSVFQAIVADYPNFRVDPSQYTRLPQYFSKDGDLDGDGATNYEEFLEFGDTPEHYMAAVTDPAVHPLDDEPEGVDFCQALEDLRTNSLIPLLVSEEDLDFTDLLDPAVADLNGPSWIEVVVEGGYSVSGNGMLDCSYELGLLNEALTNPDFEVNGLTHAMVEAAWVGNDAQFAEDVGVYWPLLRTLAPGIDDLLKGMMLLGDGSAAWSTPDYLSWNGSAGLIQGLFLLLEGEVAQPDIDLEEYYRLPEYFSAEGDLDGDGCSNREEYLAHGASPEEYLAAATDPAVADCP
jgi:hypothetical protein